jgi:hypothetical protein
MRWRADSAYAGRPSHRLERLANHQPHAGDSGESGDGAAIEPLLPVAHVSNDFGDRMWKAVRFRVRLVAGESFKTAAGPR